MRWAHRNCIEPASCWRPPRRPRTEACTRGDLRRRLPRRKADQSFKGQNRRSAAKSACAKPLDWDDPVTEVWTLGAAGHDLVKVNPTRARRFAQAISQGAKTDRVDAAMLARMGAVLELDAKPARSESMHEIRELHIARLALNKDRTACRNRQEGARNKVILAQLRARLRQVDGQIEQINAELARLIAEDPGLARREAILRSIPGIGAVTAVAMIVEMPELGTMEGKEAASLAGLAPITRESGKWKGRTKIGGGRRGVRSALYMPALVAIRHNPQLGAIYRALCNAGKPAKLAITAVMRRLMILANALIRDDRKWTETAP